MSWVSVFDLCSSVFVNGCFVEVSALLGLGFGWVLRLILLGVSNWGIFLSGLGGVGLFFVASLVFFWCRVYLFFQLFLIRDNVCSFLRGLGMVVTCKVRENFVILKGCLMG